MNRVLIKLWIILLVLAGILCGLCLCSHSKHSYQPDANKLNFDTEKTNKHLLAKLFVQSNENRYKPSNRGTKVYESITEADDKSLTEFHLTIRTSKSDEAQTYISDILSTSHRTARTVVAKQDRIWDFGVIPYKIDRVFNDTQRALFRDAMNHWENHTCIKFVPREPDIHPNFITFTILPCGCCSFVGKRGNGGQAISIGKDCDKFGIVVHELGHVIGFWHEHTRPDRDDHIFIDRANIIENQEYNFKVLTNEEVDSLGMPYDYDSIMHYARNTFSKSSYLDTIVPKQMTGKGRPEIGQRYNLSKGDVRQANMLYKCPVCGHTFQNEEGTFSSPSYNPESEFKSDGDEICEWRITTVMGQKIQISIANLSIFESDSCTVNYLELRDGYWEKSTLIGRYCGNATEIKAQTSSNRLLIKYVNTHRNAGYSGFKASYTTFCGGELSTTVDNRIVSPNFPLNYLPNKECTWKITAPQGYHIALKFEQFQLESHKTCRNDYVEIRNEDAVDVYCGNEFPPVVRSKSNQLVLTFASDMTVQRMGFSAVFVNDIDECAVSHDCEQECINTFGSYKCACHVGYKLSSDGKKCQDSCGDVIEVGENIGTITSPSFPDAYPNNNDCTWELVAPTDRQIFLNFTHFNLEGSSQHLDCNYDNVTLFTQTDDNRLKHLGTFCGSTPPPIIASENNILHIEFHSDKSIQRSGFSANYFTDINECAKNNGNCQHFCENTLGSFKCSCRNGYILNENDHDCDESDCKFEFFKPYGIIRSPDYPDFYGPNSDCVWFITVLPGQRIRLIFTEMDVEFHQECVYDYLTIYDGPSSLSSSLGKFCGKTKPHPITSTTNELYFNFKSDNTSHHTGFVIFYSAICGGYLRATNYTQHFYSHPKYGLRNYKHNMDCTWTIQSDPDYSVQLTFDAFEIEHTDNCNFDFVEIYDYSGPSGKYFGKFCGNSIPPNITSISDALVVRFRSDSDLNLKGFAISYTEVEASDDYETILPESAEIVTPFPGYQKSIYLPDWDDGTAS